MRMVRKGILRVRLERKGSLKMRVERKGLPVLTMRGWRGKDH